MRIIPAIDIIEGKCVRLTKGDYTQKKIYNEDPLEVAKSFEEHGIEYLHMVDLDGAKSSNIINWRVLERITSNTSLKVDFGGGIKSDESIRIAFECGAQQITGGSIAVKNENLFINWLRIYGSDKIILGADALNEKIAINGWQKDSGISLLDFIEKYQKKGVQYVICTDISKDGALSGSSIELYAKLIEQFPGLKFIASGGVTRITELDQLMKLGIDAAIIGKAIYENKITLKQLENYVS